MNLDFIPFLILALPPVIFWIIFFLKFEPNHKILGIITFLIGCSSVLPVRLYNENIQTIQNLITNEESTLYFWSRKISTRFAQSPVFDYLLEFIYMFTITAVFILLIAGLICLIWSFASSIVDQILDRKSMFTNFHVHLLNSTKNIIQELSNFTFLGIFIGLIVILTALLGLSIESAVLITILLAGIEEYAKHLIVRSVDDDRFTSVRDAIIFSALVGVAFSFVENAMYFQSSYGTDTFMPTLIGRSILLVIAHATFSGIFGYFYGVGHFAQPLMVERMVSHPTFFFRHHLHTIFHLRSTTSFREKCMMEGLIISVTLHASFNLCMQDPSLNTYGFLIVFLGAGYLFYLITKLKNQKQYGLIGTRAIPSTLDYLQTLEKIREAQVQEGIDPDHAEHKVKDDEE